VEIGENYFPVIWCSLVERLHVLNSVCTSTAYIFILSFSSEPILGEHSHLVTQCRFKRIVHPKMKNFSSFTQESPTRLNMSKETYSRYYHSTISVNSVCDSKCVLFYPLNIETCIYPWQTGLCLFAEVYTI